MLKSDNESFHARLPKTLIAQLRLQAEKERRTMTNLLKVLLEDSLAAIPAGRRGA